MCKRLILKHLKQFKLLKVYQIRWNKTSRLFFKLRRNYVRSILVQPNIIRQTVANPHKPRGHVRGFDHGLKMRDHMFYEQPRMEFKISCLNSPNSEQLATIGGTPCFHTRIKEPVLDAARKNWPKHRTDFSFYYCYRMGFDGISVHRGSHQGLPNGEHHCRRG